MKKYFVALFFVVLFVGSVVLVSAAGSTTQESMLAEIITQLKAVTNNLAALITNIQKSGSSAETSAEVVVPNASLPSTGERVPVATQVTPPQPSQEDAPILGNTSVTSPKTGEKWLVGKTYNIKWTLSPKLYKYVKIWLVDTINNKESLITWNPGAPGTVNTYQNTYWKVVGPTGKYKIKIYPIENPKVIITSGEFEIISNTPVPVPSSAKGTPTTLRRCQKADVAVASKESTYYVNTANLCKTNDIDGGLISVIKKATGTPPGMIGDLMNCPPQSGGGVGTIKGGGSTGIPVSETDFYCGEGTGGGGVGGDCGRLGEPCCMGGCLEPYDCSPGWICLPQRWGCSRCLNDVGVSYNIACGGFCASNDMCILYRKCN